MAAIRDRVCGGCGVRGGRCGGVGGEGRECGMREGQAYSGEVFGFLLCANQVRQQLRVGRAVDHDGSVG